mgnify:CR=1 FL=1
MLDESGLDLLFQKARTPRRWLAKPVETSTLQRLYDLVSLGPTSGNCSPARFVFITGSEGREKLRPALSAGNVNRVMGAPVIAIIAHDPLFFEYLSRLCPNEELRSWSAADVGLAVDTAFRTGTLRGAYLLMAARASWLDSLPCS